MPTTVNQNILLMSLLKTALQLLVPTANKTMMMMTTLAVTATAVTTAAAATAAQVTITKSPKLPNLLQ